MNSRSHSTRRSAAFSPRRNSLLQARSRAASAKLASAILLLSGLASSGYADATWVGGTSQDWNTAANWSSTAAGVLTINTATAGVFPIISGASAFSPTDIVIGTGAGQVGRLDLNAATAGTGANNTGSANWLLMGINGGTGTLNIGAGSTFLGRVHMLRTTVSSTATINVDGTLTSPGEVVIADGQNNQPAVQGTMNVNGGGTVNSEGDLIVAFAGNASTFGELNIAAGAIVNVASTAERWLIVNQWDGVQGRINVNGGALNLNANTDIRFNTGNSIGASSITLNSGAITGGATSVIDLDRNVNNAAVNNTLNLNGGTLTMGQIMSQVAAGTRTINFNGTTLKPAAAGTFITATAASVANVKAGGAIFDSNGFDIAVAKALTADAVSTGGGLTKLGAGVLTLSGVNTYTGNTTVTDGGLSLADNASLKFVIGASGVSSKLTGATTGAITLDGDFEFDLTTAGTTIGNSWQIVDAALTETFGSTFTVTGFTLTSGKWIKPANGAFYEFDTATGVLKVIADPAIVFPPPTVTPAASRASYPLGSDFTLSVSAVGTGTLTYKWYYQANSGDSLHLISGATSASYPITSATAGSGGIYTVVVTDSAAATTPTTVAFPVISVVPGTAFTVAYYRFEDGVADAFITSTIDSVAGGGALTALGTPNYAADSLPYAKVPRTGANDTLGANFPATGNQGLIAPTTGTLASAEFLDFTIEAFVRLDSLSGWQTIVGRDDSANPGEGTGAQALFYLSKANNGGFRVEVINKDNTNMQINSAFVPTVGTWYHLAAVGDASKGTLTLYVNGTSVGSTTGFTGLFVPTAGSDTPWTLGRGDYAAADVDILRGDLDEVRFSSAALPPSQFLASTDAGTVLPPVVTQAPASQTLHVGDSITLSVTATGTSTTLTYQWYKDNVLISGQTGTSLTLSGVTVANDGSYTVKVIDPISTTLGVDISTVSVPAVIRVLAVSATARAIGLNFVGTGNGSWSTASGALASSVSAGFVSAINWNNSGLGVATQTSPLTLIERNGVTPSYATATWSSANTWSARTGTGDPTTVPSQKTPDATLLHGYIESRLATGASVTVANIPYASYDVYVYVAGGANGNVGSITTDHVGSSTYYYKALQHDGYVPATVPTSGSPYSVPSVIGEATTSVAALTAPAATFVRFTGVTGADLTITAMDATLNANAGGIAAVQIVDTTSVGTPYPPTVTTAPVSQLKAGGSTATFSVAAVSNNSGGVISYQWQKNGVNMSGQTGSSLTLANVTGASTDTYGVVVTDNSSLGATSTTRTAGLVVVDATRPLLINGDLNAAGSPSFVGNGILRTTGSDTTDLGAGGGSTTVWNGVLGAAGTATRTLAKESTGLNIPGVSFTYAGAEGVEDNTTAGAIAGTATEALVRDYLYTDNQATPLTGSIGGLQAFAGKQVTLVVYAYGKLTQAGLEATTSDAATVTLTAGNNHLASAPYATSTIANGFADDAGRRLDYNNLDYTLGASAAYATFTGVVAADGTVGWSLSPDADAGRIPLVGFQLLVTNTDIAPPAPTNLVAVGGSNQIGLTWSASTGATSYTIQRATTAGGPYTTLSAGLITAASYTDTSVTAGTTYYYVVAAANALAQSANSNQASAASVSTTALQNWRQSNFGTTANTGNAANTADPDADGISNLLEYALGTNPNVAGVSPVVLGQSSGSLTLGFTPVVDANLNYVVEGSSDLVVGWSTVHTYGSFSTTAPVLYTDSVVLGGVNSRRFLRLKVTSTE